jgi:hypothetical protein
VETTEMSLDLAVEDLEPLEAPIDWNDFWRGFGAGVALVGLGVGTAALIT